MSNILQEGSSASRRDVIAGAALMLASTPVATAAAQSSGDEFVTNEYWAQRANVRLYMYRKRLAAGPARRPVLFMAHGSSISGRPTFDLSTPGLGEYSLMNVFARFGFDCWTMDFEGYGRSTVTGGNSDIKTGAADLAAAAPIVARETGLTKFHYWGESAGAIRVAAFAAAYPQFADRLILAAYTYTGKGSTTLGDRAKQLDFFRANNRRPRDINMVRSIFTRDKAGTSDPRVADLLAAAELPHGDTVPTGTYLDMTANLPITAPEAIKSPVLILRGEYDGISTMEDLQDFFAKLPNGDRQFVVLPGIAHSLQFALNRELVFHTARAFLDMPKAKQV